MLRYRVVAALAGLILHSAALAATRAPAFAPTDQDMTIAFADPTSWRCASHDGCVACRNVAPASASVRLRGGRVPDDVDVPPGASLQICPP